jgi:hypothetical protein
MREKEREGEEGRRSGGGGDGDGEGAVYWLCPLARVGPAALAAVEQLAKEPASLLTKLSPIPAESALPSSLLWSTAATFATLPAPQRLAAASGVSLAYHKRIFLFTSHSTQGLLPASLSSSPDTAGRSRNDRVISLAVGRARDAAASGVTLDLFVGHHGPFDLSPLWSPILRAFAGEDEAIRAAEGELERAEEMIASRVAASVHEATGEHDLFAQVRRRSFAKRSQGAVPFRLTKDVEIACQLYTLVQETKKGSYVWLDGRTSRALRRETSLLDATTGASVPASRIGSAFSYGNTLVPFSPSELSSLKGGGTSVGLDLLGFKDLHLLKDEHNVKHSSFVRPDESTVAGSTAAFVSLLLSLRRKEKFALVRVTPRAASAPRLAALVPSLGVGREALERGEDAETAADEAVLSPDGFHLIWLPFADDLRPVAPTNPSSLSVSPTPTHLSLSLSRSLPSDSCFSP